MDKYKVLISLILNQDIRDTYMTVEENNYYIDVKELVANEEGQYNYFSVRIQDNKVFIKNILDKDFTEVQAEELSKLIKEKNEQQNELVLKELWTRLSVF